jgi:hypothetical protein
MTWTSSEEFRIQAIERALNTIQTALNNLATKQLVKSLLYTEQHAVAQLQEELDQLEAASGVDLINAHKVDSAAHSELFAEKADLVHQHNDIYFLETEHINSTTGVADANKPIKTDSSGLIDSTFFDAGDISHTDLTDIGINTHNSIDNHLASGEIHFTEASIDHGSIAGLSDDDHTQYLLRSDYVDDGILEEAVTISVNPNTGSDVFTEIITNQTKATAHGAFASIAGALKALPSHLPNGRTVILSHAAGTWTVNSTYFYGLEKFEQVLYTANNNGNPLGGIRVISDAGFSQVTGSSDMAVASYANHFVTLASDPGYAANAYRGRFLQIISGTGSSVAIGNPKPIRTHTGTIFEHPSDWPTNPNATSVVRIVEPSLKFLITDSWLSLSMQFSGNNAYGAPFLQFEGVEFAHATPGTALLIWQRGGHLVFKDCIIQGAWLLGNANGAFRGALVIDGQNYFYNPISIVGGYFSAAGNYDGAVLRNALVPGISVKGGAQPGYAYVYRVDIDNVTDCIKLLSPRGWAVLNIYSKCRSSSCSGYGIHISEEGYCTINTSWISSPYGITGASGDIRMVDTTVTYAQLTAASQTTLINNQCIVQGVTA